VTDRQLLDRFVSGREEAAFAQLMARHGPMVWGVCCRIVGAAGEVEDAFQATFLVLARKAAGTGWHDSIANWLYGVAQRVALKARLRADRRRALECEVEAMLPSSEPEQPGSDPLTGAVHKECRALLDEELARLPARYRVPLILCYLEGKTNQEAARELGWACGSMSRYLNRARELLRRRLLARGYPIPAAMLGLVLGEKAGAVPAAVAATTLHASLTLIGKTGAGVSPAVLELVEGVTRTMFVDRLRMACLVALVVVSLGLGAGGIWHQVRADKPVLVPENAQAVDQAPGQVTPRPAGAEPQEGNGLVKISSPREGVLESILVKKDAKVQVGDVLAKLDDELARIELKRRKLNLDYLRRNPPWPDMHDIAKNMNDITKRRHETAIAELDVQEAEKVLKMHQLRSPVAGVIKTIYRHPGEGTKTGDTILLIEVAEAGK